jgi:hypothetical protein
LTGCANYGQDKTKPLQNPLGSRALNIHSNLISEDNFMKQLFLVFALALPAVAAPLVLGGPCGTTPRTAREYAELSGLNPAGFICDAEFGVRFGLFESSLTLEQLEDIRVELVQFLRDDGTSFLYVSYVGLFQPGTLRGSWLAVNDNSQAQTPWVLGVSQSLAAVHSAAGAPPLHRITQSATGSISEAYWIGIPEPSTYALICAGLISMAWLQRRR